MRPGRRDSPTGTELVGLGVFLAVAVVVPLGAGIAADGAFHRGPLGTFVGLLVGIVAGAAGVYSRFKRYL
ncbi:MAG: AtpZ/AtpI family protein [Candidatus Dormibacterales bacterium]